MDAVFFICLKNCGIALFCSVTTDHHGNFSINVLNYKKYKIHTFWNANKSIKLTVKEELKDNIVTLQK